MMEGLDNKFLPKDPTVISMLLSKLVEDIREKYEEGTVGTVLSFLQSLCLSSDNKINEMASKGILKLLEEGIIDSNKMMEDFITVIPNNEISKGVVKTICGMLYYQFSKSSKNSQNKLFNIYFPQHPFITLLITNSKCFPHIYKEVRLVPKRDEIQSWNMWNYAFYQYCFCNPINKEPMFITMKLWMYLLSNHDELVFRLITWMSVEEKRKRRKIRRKRERQSVQRD